MRNDRYTRLPLEATRKPSPWGRGTASPGFPEASFFELWGFARAVSGG